MHRYTIFFIIANAFLRPLLGAQEMYTQHLVCVRLVCFCR